MQAPLKTAIRIDLDGSVLSGEFRIQKTERFIKQTVKFKDFDAFLSKLSEGIILNTELFSVTEEGDCFRLKTVDDLHSFRFVLDKSGTAEVPERRDIIFFEYDGEPSEAKRNDTRLLGYIRGKSQFSVLYSKEKVTRSAIDFKKLYRLSNSDGVNMPLLNAEQRRIVETENQNVLVQGVAGSGKTNICIERIVFTACREYAGRVLYSTYSRGLLIDTESKVRIFIDNLKSFVKEYEEGRVIFADKYKKKAIENRLGIYFSEGDEERICKKIGQIIEFLESKVDYLLLEDIYRKYFGDAERVVGETFFVREYLGGMKNHQLSGKLAKIKNISFEVIFKEIYGMVFGCYDLSEPKPSLTLAEYTERRKDSFSASECEVIYLLARDYGNYLEKRTLIDNNVISRRLIENAASLQKYSLAILDEVQDMTEVNLCLIKTLSMKMFCVGDALQMINPSYFSFAYLKRLLFEKDLVSVAELANNYRNTKKIAGIVEKLEQINLNEFGTHSFVLKGVSIDSDVPTSTVYVNGGGFVSEAAKHKFDNFTVIVSSVKQKEKLRELLKRQEILTVSEVKGLERDVVVLYNLLSDSADKWSALERTLVNRKRADENSVYRYYFNLFYVGISRAKTHIYVVEDKEISVFKRFFERSFANLSVRDAIDDLSGIVARIDLGQDEVLERVKQFITLGQWDNARFAAEKITDGTEKQLQRDRIDVNEEFVFHGKYREAGIAFWERGMFNDARTQFTLSKDDALIELMEASTGGESRGLNVDIVRFLPDVERNEVAKNFILQVVKKDLDKLREAERELNAKFRKIKEKK